LYLFESVHFHYKIHTNLIKRDQGSITRMLDKLEMTPLQDRRRSARLAYFYEMVEGWCQQCQVMTS